MHRIIVLHRQCKRLITGCLQINNRYGIIPRELNITSSLLRTDLTFIRYYKWLCFTTNRRLIKEYPRLLHYPVPRRCRWIQNTWILVQSTESADQRHQYHRAKRCLEHRSSHLIKYQISSIWSKTWTSTADSSQERTVYDDYNQRLYPIIQWMCLL